MFEKTTSFVLRIKNKPYLIDEPKIMAILNVTPDSFHDGGKYSDQDNLKKRIDTIVAEGADIIDIGGQSSRPGAIRITAREEWKRIRPAVEYCTAEYPEIPISIDTYYSEVFSNAYCEGAAIVNDISGWRFDPDLPKVAADLHVPYILMHMQGEPATMQRNPAYRNVVADVLSYLDKKKYELTEYGVTDIILDPGIGFGKTLNDNLLLIKHIDLFTRLDSLVLLGVSRKSMFEKITGLPKEETLGANSAIHFMAMQAGVRILRVHDVKETVLIRKLFLSLNEAQ